MRKKESKMSLISLARLQILVVLRLLNELKLTLDT